MDSKSDESALPYFSNGNRDDLIQHRYLQALISYWDNPENNPEASQYTGRMINTDRAHVWAWDARPFPDFPERLEVWSDGGQFVRGHWVSGRIHLASLGAVVTEICRRSGVEDIDVSKLHGLVRGFLIGNTESARQSLQPLMLAYGFDCFDQDGVLVFRNRDGKIVSTLDPDWFAVDGDEPIMNLTRSPMAETAGRLRVGYIDAENDYQSGAAEHLFPDESEANIAESDLPLALIDTEGQAIAERWLSEARIAKDEVSFALPPSQADVAAGDVVSIPHGGQDSLFRVDRVEDSGLRRVHGTRIEAGVYSARYRDGAIRYRPGPAQFGSVYAELLDLPLLTGAEEPHQFHIAAASDPWPGRIAVYSASEDFGYNFNCELTRNAVVGNLRDPLPGGISGIWQRDKIRIKIASGILQSRSEIEVMNGANRAALRVGGVGDWEIIQFCDAVLVGENEYSLSKFLRGQAGTEFLVPAEWPVNTDFVLLDSAVQQVSMTTSERGLERHYRIGPSHLAYDHDDYIHEVFAGQGVGLRPYEPVHLRADNVAGDHNLSWVRRTRVDGDVWQSYDVPLGEDREVYILRISDGTLKREVELTSPFFTYTAAMKSADGVGGAFIFEVAQLSDRFGVGPFNRRSVNV